MISMTYDWLKRLKDTIKDIKKLFKLLRMYFFVRKMSINAIKVKNNFRFFNFSFIHVLCYRN
jgi:hypothetical protein